MNNEEARKILALYRPGTADQTDPSFKEALERAKPDAAPAGRQDKPEPELGRWFQEHCSSYLSIQAKFLKIPTPPGLKDRILAEVRTAGFQALERDRGRSFEPSGAGETFLWFRKL